MPVIRVEFDDSVVNKDTAEQFCQVMRKIVTEAMAVPENDVCLYGNKSLTKINTAPMQVWLEVSDYKVADKKKLADSIRAQIMQWKGEEQFAYQIKFMLVPRNQVVVKAI